MALLWSLISTFIISALSLIGVFTLLVKKEILQKILFYLIGFSAGALIGGAFLHILPEVLEQVSSISTFSCVIAGFVLFFLLERYFFWRHCHEGVCDVHAFTYLSLIGDGIHNFFDGVMIAVSFCASWQLGTATTLAVILHEIPQELGDFGILVFGGLNVQKALFFNFVSALTAVLGALFGFFMAESLRSFSFFVLPITAGGFIYIAASDLIPQLHKERDRRRSTLAFFAFVTGILLMVLTKIFFEH
jgi:zinc and cadmium transporter